jgi:hypothetical protein
MRLSTASLPTSCRQAGAAQVAQGVGVEAQRRPIPTAMSATRSEWRAVNGRLGVDDAGERLGDPVQASGVAVSMRSAGS